MLRPRTTEEEYKYIKELLRIGYGSTAVAKMTKRSKSTVQFMKRSENYNDYLDIIKSYQKEIKPTELKTDKRTDIDSLSWNVHQLNQTLNRLLDLVEAR